MSRAMIQFFAVICFVVVIIGGDNTGNMINVTEENQMLLHDEALINEFDKDELPIKPEIGSIQIDPLTDTEDELIIQDQDNPTVTNDESEEETEVDVSQEEETTEDGSTSEETTEDGSTSEETTEDGSTSEEYNATEIVEIMADEDAILLK